MSNFRIGFSALLVLALAAFGATCAHAATGEPNVARVSLLRGRVDLKRADSGDTVLATINAPLGVGDYIATHEDARAEVEFGFASALRVGPATSIRFVALDGERHRVQLAAGTVELRIARGLRAHPEIETPQATVRPTEAGRYRVSVASDGATTVTVRSGRADVVTDTRTRAVLAGATLAFGGGLDDTSIRTVVAASDDDFDRWNDERDRAIAIARNDAYVDDGMVGADDLNAYGRWIDNSRYGRVWSPNEGSSWAPYHDGRFVWEPYYGWTWVGAEPWGWAPYHYGNWFYAANSGWCWYPGAYASDRPFVYRPASVAFFSFGGGWPNFGFGNIGWVPLAPYEAFAPWYGGYRNTTVVNNITNVTNVTIVNPAPATAHSGNLFTIYHNGSAPGGAVGLDRRSFADGNFGKLTSVAPATLAKAALLRGGVPIVPTRNNLRYSAQPVAVAPIFQVDERFAHFSPPAIRTQPFVVQQAAIRASIKVAPSVPAVVLPHAALPSVFVPVSLAPKAITPSVVVARPTLARPDVTRPIVMPVSIDWIAPGAAPKVPVRHVRPIIIVAPASPWDRFKERASVSEPTSVRSQTSAAMPFESETLGARSARGFEALPRSAPLAATFGAPISAAHPHLDMRSLATPSQIAPARASVPHVRAERATAITSENPKHL